MCNFAGQKVHKCVCEELWGEPARGEVGGGLLQVWHNHLLQTCEYLSSIFLHFFSLRNTCKVKDRSLSDEKEDGEEGGVENGGDCKNKGFGFVSFQASKSNS